MTDQTARRPLWRNKADRIADEAHARAVAAQARIEEQRALDQARLEQLEAQREHQRVQADLDAHARQKATAAAEKRRTLRQRISLAVVLASANIGVNASAVLGQVLALVYGLHWDWWQALPLAFVVESVAVNVGYFAHDKLIKGYSAFGLRILSYGIGAGVAYFNYSHNAHIKETGDFAGVFGAASLLSPVLWQIYSQWRHWETMRAQGLLEQRSLRFPWLRWVIPSLRTETWEAFKHGVAEGIHSPEVALADVRAKTATATADQAVRDCQTAVIRTQSDLITVTQMYLAEVGPAVDEVNTGASIGHPVGELGGGVLAVTAAVTSPTTPADDEVNIATSIECPPDAPETGPAPATEVFTGEADDDDPDSDRDRPDDQDNREAEKWIRGRMRAGRTPTYDEVKDKYDFSRGWARLRVLAARDEMAAKGYVFLPRNVVKKSADTVTVNGAESDHAGDVPMTTVGGA